MQPYVKEITNLQFAEISIGTYFDFEGWQFIKTHIAQAQHLDSGKVYNFSEGDWVHLRPYSIAGGLFCVKNKSTGKLMGEAGKPYTYSTYESAQQSAQEWQRSLDWHCFDHIPNNFEVIDARAYTEKGGKL